MNPKVSPYNQHVLPLLNAEAFCAAIIENGVDFDNIDVFYEGGFRQTYRNDIEQVKYEYEGDPDAVIQVNLNRNGIYDNLPEGLFHQSKGTARTSSTRDMISEHRQYKDEEKLARKFFKPLQQELFKAGVAQETEERRLLFASLVGDVPASFFSFWSIDSHLPIAPATMLIRVLPFARHIKGNKTLTAKTLALVLNKPVQVTEIIKQEQHTGTQQNFFECGRDALLGINTITGHTVHEPSLCWQFTIGELDSEEMETYVPHQPMGKLLQRFTELFIPLITDVEFSFDINQEQPTETRHNEYIMGYGFTI
jgi:hypothetical protein